MRNYFIAVIVAVFVLLPLSAKSAFAATYYFDSVAGSDTNAGTSTAAPFKSLAKLNSVAYVAGDIVNLKAGSSWTGTWVVSRSGASRNPIKFQAYGTGTKPTFSKPGGEGAQAIDIDANWIVLDGVMATNTGEAGIRVEGSNNIVQNVEVKQSGIGIYVDGTSNLVTHSYFHDLVMVLNTPANIGDDDDYGAIGALISNDNNEVSYNKFENCRAPSLDYGYDGGVIEIWRNANNTNIHHNWTKDNNGFLEAGSDQTSTANNMSVTNNVMINNGSVMGIHFGGTYKTSVTGMKVQNNTIVEPTGVWDLFGSWQGTGPSTAVLIQNNIIYTDQKFMDVDSSYAHDHNLFYFVGQGGLGHTTLGSTEQIADPQFVNLASNDLHLKITSPARGKGIAIAGMNFDYEGKAINNPVDLGAYQYLVPLPSPTPTSTLTPTLTPAISAACKADIDQSGFVDLQDYSYLVNDFFKTTGQMTRTRSDIDGSGFVDLTDYSKLVSAFFQSCP